MALKSSFVPDPFHLLTRAEGAVDDADLADHHRRVSGMCGLVDGTRELVDLRGADLRGVTGHGIRRLADLVASQSPRPTRLRRVAIIGDTDLAYGLGRMYEAHLAHSATAVAVFRDASEARRWLFAPDGHGGDDDDDGGTDRDGPGRYRFSGGSPGARLAQRLNWS